MHGSHEQSRKCYPCFPPRAYNGGKIFRLRLHAIGAGRCGLLTLYNPELPCGAERVQAALVMSVAVRLMCSDVSQNGSGKAEPQITRAKGLSIKGRTAQIVNGKLVMVDAAGEDATRSLSASPEPLPASSSAAPAEEAPVASTSQASTQSSSSKPPGSRPKLTRRLTRYFCTWEDCAKSYAKPVRLEEHLRSHTGERPYKCSHEGCGASYLRDTHLVAHMRTHLDEKDKPFTCRVDGCEKRFWTNQHLNRHVKLVHEQNSGAYKVSCPHIFFAKSLSPAC